MPTEQFEESNPMEETLGDEENLVENEIDYDQASDEEVEVEEEVTELEEDLEEVEIGGTTYKVPAAIKSSILMQQDYTRKTEEVANQKRALQEQTQYQQQNIEAIAKIMAIDEQITQYDNVDWSAFIEQDPIKAQQLLFEASKLKDARVKLIQHAQYTDGVLKQQKITEREAALTESNRILKQEIPGWSEPLETKLQQFAVSRLGFDMYDLQEAKIDPRIYKLLNLAFAGDQVLSKKGKIPTVVVKPATSVKARQSTQKEPHNMSFSEFKKWRKETIKRRS